MNVLLVLLFSNTFGYFIPVVRPGFVFKRNAVSPSRRRSGSGFGAEIRVERQEAVQTGAVSPRR